MTHTHTMTHSKTTTFTHIANDAHTKQQKTHSVSDTETRHTHTSRLTGKQQKYIVNGTQSDTHFMTQY